MSTTTTLDRSIDRAIGRINEECAGHSPGIVDELERLRGLDAYALQLRVRRLLQKHGWPANWYPIDPPPRPSYETGEELAALSRLRSEAIEMWRSSHRRAAPPRLATPDGRREEQ